MPFLDRLDGSVHRVIVGRYPNVYFRVYLEKQGLIAILQGTVQIPLQAGLITSIRSWNDTLPMWLPESSLATLMKTKLSYITAITAQSSLLRMPLPTPGLVLHSPRLRILTPGKSFTSFYCRVGSAFVKEKERRW